VIPAKSLGHTHHNGETATAWAALFLKVGNFLDKLRTFMMKSFLGIFKKFCFSNSLQRRGKITIMEEDDYHVPQNAGPVGFRSVGIVRAIATEAGSSVS
jgi:hypothetical protein